MLSRLTFPPLSFNELPSPTLTFAAESIVPSVTASSPVVEPSPMYTSPPVILSSELFKSKPVPVIIASPPVCLYVALKVFDAESNFNSPLDNVTSPL